MERGCRGEKGRENVSNVRMRPREKAEGRLPPRFECVPAPRPHSKLSAACVAYDGGQSEQHTRGTHDAARAANNTA